MSRREPIRAVLNTNVLLSALMRPTGPPGRVVGKLVAGRFEAVTSAAIGDEVRRASRYAAVRGRIPLTDEELDLWLAAFEVLAISVEPRLEVSVVRADPDDDKYIAAALEGGAQFVVSGDSHLLDLGDYEGIAIVTPRAFLGRVAERADEARAQRVSSARDSADS